MRNLRSAPAIALICAALPISFLAVAARALAQSRGDLTSRFDEAERRIVRLSPTDVPELPGNLIRELPSQRDPRGVRQTGQTDWAVLCSVKGVSTILVFWHGSEKDVAELNGLEDRIFLHTTTLATGLTLLADDPIGFSRRISAVALNDHQGIEDASVLKRSLWYFYDGGWSKL